MAGCFLHRQWLWTLQPQLQIGPSTEIVAGQGLIMTAGAVDCHVHLISPTQIPEALAAGVTTWIAGGTGPADGTKATTVTPGAWYLARILESLDEHPLNIALLGKGNTVGEQALRADFSNLWQAYRNNIQLLRLERQNLISAKENHEIAKERYLLGDLSGIEMREAQKSLLDAEERILSAEYDTKMCEISLLQISGKITQYLE